MKYHIMYTLEHGYSLEANSISEAELAARLDLAMMMDPTAKLMSIIVDCYVQPVEKPKLLEVDIDMDPSAA